MTVTDTKAAIDKQIKLMAYLSVEDLSVMMHAAAQALYARVRDENADEMWEIVVGLQETIDELVGGIESGRF